MSEEDKTQDQPGDEGAGAGGGDDENKGSGGADDTSKFVTPEILTGSHDALKRTFSTQVKALEEKIGSQLKELSGTIAGLKNVPDEGGGPDEKKKSSGKDAELAALRQTVSDMDTKLKDAETKAEAAAQRERDGKFRSQVKNAMLKAGCKPERADLVTDAVLPKLSWDDEKGEAFHTHKTDWDEEARMDLKKFAEDVVRDDLFPELFSGTTRAGTPAGGESSAAGGRRFEFSMDQVLDPVFYEKNREKIVKALAEGRVKGAPTA